MTKKEMVKFIEESGCVIDFSFNRFMRKSKKSVRSASDSILTDIFLLHSTKNRHNLQSKLQLTAKLQKIVARFNITYSKFATQYYICGEGVPAA